MICELLGANWYAVAATAGLGALAVCHIVYAFILTAQNRRARGDNRYAVTEKPATVELASQNMPCSRYYCVAWSWTSLL